MKRHILMISTGGTIASAPSGNGLSPQITSDQILASIAGAMENCQVDTLQIMNIDSVNIQPEHWLLLAKTIRENYARFDGFVITHGTDTMSYTAAALCYLIQNPDKPVVLTGAQVPLEDPLSDAKKNLIDSIRFAAEGGACGVFIVFSGVVIIGTRAKKLKTKSFDAFASINFPEYAIVEGRRILRFPVRYMEGLPTRFFYNLCPDVFLLKLTPGLDPGILEYLGKRYRAIVIECYGVGGLPFLDRRSFLDEIGKIDPKDCLVVMATQAMLEGSDALLYEVGKNAVMKYGMLQSYDMTVEAVMTKLMWLLGRGLSTEEIKRAFYEPVAQDILLQPEAGTPQSIK